MLIHRVMLFDQRLLQRLVHGTRLVLPAAQIEHDIPICMTIVLTLGALLVWQLAKRKEQEQKVATKDWYVHSSKRACLHTRNQSLYSTASSIDPWHTRIELGFIVFCDMRYCRTLEEESMLAKAIQRYPGGAAT